MSSFKIATLGCRTNQYESSAYKNQLEALGYNDAKEGESADICIINTCTVTEGADRDSRASIRKIIRNNPGAKVVVTGCYAERNPNLKNEIEGIDHIIKNTEKEDLMGQIFPDIEVPEFKINHFDAHTRAFVKVQDGCNSYCTYCIIPYVRGRSRSKTIEEVVKEVEALVLNGYKEVVLTGINIGDFDGKDGTKRLSDLIRAVDQVEGLERLRVSSIDPDEVEDDVIDVLLTCKTTCPSMHIVLQSGSNVTLKKMNRKYTRQVFLKTIERLKAIKPTFTFTTDVIVGFPGETEQDLQETLDVMSQVKFAKVHMFPYSERPRTKAAQYPNKVPEDVIKERKERVLRASELHSFELRQTFLNQTMKVLIEGKEGFGHTENFLPVYVQGEGFVQNQIVDVLLIENNALGLIGKPL